MRLFQLCRVAAPICCLWLADCSRFSPDAASSNVPAESHRVATFELKYADGPGQPVRGALVTPTFFDAAKALPLVGRRFLPEEYRSPATVVLLSDRLWKQRFGGDLAVLGKTLQLDAQRLTVLGVMPSTFDVPHGADLWVPMPGAVN
jgi:hypothetical protein